MIFGRTRYAYGSPEEFYARTELILKRDNFTCQLCGYKAKREKYEEEEEVEYCGICADKGFLFEPMLELRPPSKCIFHKVFESCEECPHLREVRVKVPPFEHKLPEGIIVTFSRPLHIEVVDGEVYFYDASYLLVHHINGDNCDNYPENLITLCRSCHMKVHRSKDRGKLTEILKKKAERLTKEWIWKRR